MKSKICIKCSSEKNLEEFNKAERNKDGYNNTCKNCKSEYGKLYRISNYGEIIKKERERESSIKNKNIRQKYRDCNKEKIKKYSKKWHDYNKNHNKEWIKNNPEKKREIDKRYCEKPEKKIKIKKRQNKYLKERKSKEPSFKLSCILRSIVNLNIKKGGYNKNYNINTEDIVGCNFEFLKNYIEEQWSLQHNLDENGNIWMCWDNHGLYEKDTLNYGWDIDHITPLLPSKRTEQELIKLCHYSNLQPLCSYVNRVIKKDKLNFHL